MRAPVRWLKDYVSFDEAPELLGERLTMAGIPVEGIDRPCEGLRNIVTGLITRVDPHPNAVAVPFAVRQPAHPRPQIIGRAAGESPFLEGSEHHADDLVVGAGAEVLVRPDDGVAGLGQ